MLDEFDRELTRRGLRFCRYADDCNIYVRSRRRESASMASVCRFLTTRLQLKVNESKSAVASKRGAKVPGIHDLERCRANPADRRKRPCGSLRSGSGTGKLSSVVSVPDVCFRDSFGLWARYLIGWRGYFGFCQTPIVVRNLDAWIRRRLRMYIWRQMGEWGKDSVTRMHQLRRQSSCVPTPTLLSAAGARSGCWRMARHVTVQQAMPNAYFDSIGLPRLAEPTTA